MKNSKSKNYCRLPERQDAENQAPKNLDYLKKKYTNQKRNGVIILTTLVTHDYVEKDHLLLSAQLTKMAENAPAYATKYKYTVTDLAEMVADAAFFAYYVTQHGDVPAYGIAWTQKGEDMLFGTGVVVSLWPQGLNLVAHVPPANVPNGIVARYREKVQRAKSQKSIYLVDDGVIMGFEKAPVVFVPGDGKPDPKISLVAGGHPQLKFIISQYQQLEIQVDRGDGHGMGALDKTKNTHYVDNSTLPAAGVSTVWKYQMIYWFNNARVGAWSNVVEVTVKGY